MKQSYFSLSSLSHKYLMALAGLFLMLFLCTHLLTNLLMLAGDGGAAFDKAVQFLLTNPLVKITEYILFAGFIIHIAIGVLVWAHNTRARPVKYHVAPKSETAAFSRYMFHTGVVVFVFLVIHLINFFFVKLGIVPLPDHAGNVHDFYAMAEVLFANYYYSAFYIICLLFLGFHLKHAFQSAFQTFGLNHSRYMPAIKVIGTVYSIVISLGFISIPVYFLFFH